MYKEIIISVVILVFIFGLNYITEKNTDKTVDTMNENLRAVREDLVKEDIDKEKIKEDTFKAYDKWEELDGAMAYYIEHDELEKVKTAITSVKSYVEMEEYSQSVEAIDKCIYILEHIRHREMFKMDNIF